MSIAITIVLTAIASQALPRMVRGLLTRIRRLPRVQAFLGRVWPPLRRRTVAGPPTRDMPLSAELACRLSAAPTPMPVAQMPVERLSEDEQAELVAWAQRHSAPVRPQLPASHAAVPHGGLISLPAGEELSHRPSADRGHPHQSAAPAMTLPPRGDEMPRARVQGITDRSVDALITDDSVIIGRDPRSADILVEDLSVSGRHCQLLFRSGQWYAVDLGSSSGTLVAGQIAPVDIPILVRDGEVLQVGAVELRLSAPSASAARMVFDAAARTVQGGQAGNEDAHLVLPDLIAVADGVGGLPAGHVASQLAVDAMRGLHGAASLDDVVVRINDVVRARGAGDPRISGLATTFDAAKLVSDTWGWRVIGAHVGDGAVIAGAGSSFRILTKTHTFGQRLVDNGVPNAEVNESRTHLDRALGLNDRVEVDHWSEPATAGQRFLLTTDGLISALGTEQVIRLLAESANAAPSEVANLLIREAAARAQLPDDVTVVVADVSHA